MFELILRAQMEWRA